MQESDIQKILQGVSLDRFSPYQLPDDRGLRPALARYLWNTALSEALYQSLNAVEILLRNSLHSFFTEIYNTPVWFAHHPLRNHQQDSLKDTVKYLIERKRLPLSSIQLDTPEAHERYEVLSATEIIQILTQEASPQKHPGMIVASMTFGFWTGFFHNEFEDFWRKNPGLSLVFPNFNDRPQGQLLRKPLNKRFQAIKEQLRNRVFHHEPIWNQRILMLNYQKTLDVIYWISPEKYKLLVALDRFPTLYEQGWEYYLNWLDEIGQSEAH